MAKPTHNLSASVDKRPDENGKIRNIYTNIGAGWYDAKTKQMKIKIESIPVQFNGYITAFPADRD